MDGEKLRRYANQEKVTLQKVLEKLSDRDISRRTGLDAESISRIRKGKAVRRETLAKLMKFVRAEQAHGARKQMSSGSQRSQLS